MFLDLFYLLVTDLKPKTAKKGQALISEYFSRKCGYSMEIDRYSLQVSSLLSSGFKLQLHDFFSDFLWHSLLALSFGIY